jgi:hypothetical protein
MKFAIAAALLFSTTSGVVAFQPSVLRVPTLGQASRVKAAVVGDETFPSSVDPNNARKDYVMDMTGIALSVSSSRRLPTLAPKTTTERSVVRLW